MKSHSASTGQTATSCMHNYVSFRFIDVISFIRLTLYALPSDLYFDIIYRCELTPISALVLFVYRTWSAILAHTYCNLSMRRLDFSEHRQRT